MTLFFRKQRKNKTWSQNTCTTYHPINTLLRIIEQICEILLISKKVVGVTLKWYLNEKNLIHGLVMAAVLKLSPQIFKTYFRFVHCVAMIFSFHRTMLTGHKVSVLAWEAPQVSEEVFQVF